VAIAPMQLVPEKTAWLRVVESQETILSRLLELETQRWVTKDTTRVQLSFLVYNAPKDVLSLSDINFLFARSGHIWKQITHRTLAMTPYNPVSTVLFDLMFYLQITWIFIMEAKELLSEMKLHDTKINALKVYLQFWNVVDWLSIILAYTLMFVWMAYCTKQAAVSEDLKGVEAAYEACLATAAASSSVSCDATLMEFLPKVQEVGDLARTYRWMGGCYPILIMLRLFKAFSAQPRLAVVSNTLSSSFPDVFHFGVVFLSLFITYSVMGTVLFGRELRAFVTVPRACFTCFRALMGDFDVEAMYKPFGRFITIMYFGSFMIIVFLLMLNMLLAIIMDVYTEVKGKCSSSEPLWSQTFALIRRYRQKKRGERVDLGEVLAAYESQYGEEAFACEEIMVLDSFVSTVPGIPASQAQRLLYQACQTFATAHEEPLSIELVMGSMHHTMSKIWELSARYEKSEALALQVENTIRDQLAAIKHDIGILPSKASSGDPQLSHRNVPDAPVVAPASEARTGSFGSQLPVAVPSVQAPVTLESPACERPRFVRSPSGPLCPGDVVRLAAFASVDELLCAARAGLEDECGSQSSQGPQVGRAMAVESLEAVRKLCKAAMDKAFLSHESGEMVVPAELTLLGSQAKRPGQSGECRPCIPCR